ncbi:SipW-dependent-type signal peptide-containing protein [Halorubrum saccharovorum]|uniref:SipW-dependent-type signal peptide-containing protein n=1 Tax=Halorubrum saccharovorum TaxID=2248 RepID=UPI0009B5B84D|nr:SipW-dependent-type signal peptide-containing protein [Halorubrum saccharovorum]
MTRKSTDIGLSRRRLLGGLGAIGLASAGAGLGTTAYFSDEETLANNDLTAGTLDLGVRYEFAADQAVETTTTRTQVAMEPAAGTSVSSGGPQRLLRASDTSSTTSSRATPAGCDSLSS